MTLQQPDRAFTFRDLVGRLTDLRRLATRPVAGETTGTFTSYDRSSTFDEAAGTYQDWGANADGSGYIRKHEDGGLVVFDTDGPGVIWRIWSALPAEGHMRVYIDGRAEPVFDRPFRDLFDHFADERSPANFPALMPTLSRGRNCWIPLAYQHHATIVLDEAWGAYHHISHSTFPPGWTVPSFDGTFSPDDAIALAEADRALSTIRSPTTRPVGERIVGSGAPRGGRIRRAGRAGRGWRGHSTSHPGTRTLVALGVGRAESFSTADDSHHLGP